MNTLLSLPYGKTHVTANIPQEELSAVLEAPLSAYSSERTQEELVKAALDHPIGAPSLEKLAAGASHILIITSDHTRPMPSAVTLPLILSALRRGNPESIITILIATGCHRATTREEIIHRFGQDIADREHILVHNCDTSPMAAFGVSPCGNEIQLNALVAQSHLVLAEGFIEPHFFAGFSGGRKSILPGVASRKTIMYNHCARNIQNPGAATGSLEHNPIHQDMLFAARASGIAFILNVILNSKKEIIGAVAGDVEKAHEAGVSFLRKLCCCPPCPADIVIATNGGYPLDQNIYQSVKGMTTASATCRPGGVIIMLSQCGDGHGGQEFYETFAKEPDTRAILDQIRSRRADETIPDQWQSQIFCQILLKNKVILVNDAPREMVEKLHLIHSSTLEDAIKKARELTGKEHPSITVIPDAVSVIIDS